MKRATFILFTLGIGLWLVVTIVSGQDHPHQIHLPLIVNSPLQEPYDMVTFLVGDGRLYEVQHSGGSQARHQTQVESAIFYHTKGNEVQAEWEELWYTEQFIYRGTDTSPGNDLYYTLRDNGRYGSAWAPRHWRVGDIFERNPVVSFYRKSDCSFVVGGSHRSWLLFEEFHPQLTFDSNITLNNVIQLAWLLDPEGQPEERYFYAENYGLVGWWSSDRGMSYISEIHQPGARPDNTREAIQCLDRSRTWKRPPFEGQLPYWPTDYRR